MLNQHRLWMSWTISCHRYTIMHKYSITYVISILICILRYWDYLKQLLVLFYQNEHFCAFSGTLSSFKLGFRIILLCIIFIELILLGLFPLLFNLFSFLGILFVLPLFSYLIQVYNIFSITNIQTRYWKDVTYTYVQGISKLSIVTDEFLATHNTQTDMIYTQRS